MIRAALFAAIPLALGLPGAASGQALIDRCAAATCVARLSPRQLLGEAEKLIAARRFDEARPMLAALSRVPELELETRFLTGFAAAQQGRHEAAAEQYRAILSDHPEQTRVRLELARAMLALGKTASADRQFRLAQQDEDLPPEIARTIRAVRNIIRSRRAWRLDINFGIAPDSNINNATSADTVTVHFGDTPIPLELDEDAKARSGTGQTATVSAGLRLPLAEHASMLFDLDSTGTNYSGADYDDYLVQVAAGPELRLSPTASVSVQAVGAQRWYGGDVASRQFGAKIGAQEVLDKHNRVGLQLDLRRTNAAFDKGYDGIQAALYGTWERAVSRTVVASAGVFARRDWLDEPAYSNTELGGIVGVGGELSMGINFAVSGTASRAVYDAPLAFFSPDPRRDWRLVGRATLGNRKIRVLGFSPQMSWTFTRIASSTEFFDTTRSRFTFALARYF